MSGLQDAKRLVQAHYADLERARPDNVAEILARRVYSGAVWRGVDPFGMHRAISGSVEGFWHPYLSAFSRVQRREDIFFAARNGVADPNSVWVCSMGHLMGLFDAPFLGIRPTRKIAMLRYAEFNCVADGQIVETAFFCDILHLMAQAGIRPLPQQTAAHLVQPGPRTHDGILRAAQDPRQGRETLALIERMIGSIDTANARPLARTPREELLADWHDDMIWWGPEGIGATYTIDRYIDQHQGPFRRHMRGRIFNGHLCRIAEGNYGGFFGWPNLSVVNHNGFLGLPPTDKPAEMRVVDIYRREGDRLAENWIFIDMLHFLKMQGVDVLAGLSAKAAG